MSDCMRVVSVGSQAGQLSAYWSCLLRRGFGPSSENLRWWESDCWSESWMVRQVSFLVNTVLWGLAELGLERKG